MGSMLPYIAYMDPMGINVVAYHNLIVKVIATAQVIIFVT